MLLTLLYEDLFNERTLLNTKKMITLGEIIDKITGLWNSDDKSKTKSSMGLFDGGLHLHFHIAINLVKREGA